MRIIREGNTWTAVVNDHKYMRFFATKAEAYEWLLANDPVDRS